MDLKKSLNKMAEEAKKDLKTVLMDVGVVFVSLAYILYQLLTLKPTDLNPLTLLGQAVVGIFVGILIKQAIGENGFVRGYHSDTWITRKNNYTKKADLAFPFIDKVEEFYESERKIKLRKNRKTRLANAKLKYETFFDENGDYIDHEIVRKRKNKKYSENVIALKRHQEKVLDKCIGLKIYICDIFNEYQTYLSEDEKKELSDADQRVRNFSQNLIGAIAIALMGVYFIPQWTWDWGHFLGAIFQVSMWVTFGIVQLYSNYSFVTIKKVNQLEKKEQLLSKFLISCIGKDEFERLLKQNKDDDVIELTPEQAKELLKKDS